MMSQTPNPREEKNVPELPPTEKRTDKDQQDAPMYDEGLGTPPRQPGQVDIRLPR